jgi:DDE domain
VAGHRFPPDIMLLTSGTTCSWAPRAERIAGILADRGIDGSGRTILRWVQKFGPALSEEIRRYRKPVSTTWLVDETYVKLLGKWHYLFRGVDEDGQVLDCWLSRTVTWLPPRSSSAAPSTDRVHARARRDRQRHLLSVSHPHARTGRQAHRHRLLQPGDLDQSLCP